MRLEGSPVTFILGRALRRLRSENGFTMVTILGVLFVGSLFTAAAVAVADGDIFDSQKTYDRTPALGAAEAGINDYQFHLDRDISFWKNCTTVPSPSAVSQDQLNNPHTAPKWRYLPGYSSTDPKSPKYTIELLPAANQTTYNQCDPNNPDASMIDASTGTFRVRVTGVSRNSRRSIVATFKRRSFLDYVYFTDLETQDPTFLAGDAGFATWSSSNCVRYWRDGRGTPTYSDGRKCSEINFISSENLKGPFHTNDEILICGTPTFGERPTDVVEVGGPGGAGGQGWRACGSGGTPNFVGQWRPKSPVLQLPSSNAELKNIALPGYRFNGETSITLSGNSMTVTNAGTTTTKAFPANGVIYVDTAGTRCRAYNLNDPYAVYTGSTDCANVKIHGSYSQDLTVAAANDVIVDGNLTKVSGSPALLGLIANQFVRVYHPTDASGNNAAGTITNVQIDAAMLALTHVFVVDNYFEGAPLGTLTVNGGIAQKFRGAVGTFSGSPPTSTHGFTKNYVYDRRLKFREPPFFLDPVQAQWAIRSETEQVPAANFPG
jgi:Tfp pilus assembly protein PilX